MTSDSPALHEGEPARTLSVAAVPAPGAALQADMDRLSLEQALRDVETANLRVLDLTQRLVSGNEEVRRLQQELDVARTQLAEIAPITMVTTTRTYRVTSLLLRIAGAVRRKVG